MNDTIEKIRNDVIKCVECGPAFKNMSACGFGNPNSPLVMMIAQNPWTDGKGNFKDGKGITILKERLGKHGFDDFFFDNVVKCQMPPGYNVSSVNARMCSVYLSRQINHINPAYVIVFGAFAHLSMTVNKVTDKNLVRLDHFSFPLYSPDTKALDEYYKKLFNIINRMKKGENI